MPSHDPHTQPIADALIHVQCAYTSLARWEQFGLLDRERPWFERIAPLFRRIVLVTYGGADDHVLAAALVPAAFAGRVICIANDRAEEPARFQADIPARVLAALHRAIGLPPDAQRLGHHPHGQTHLPTPTQQGNAQQGSTVRSAVVFTDQHYGGEVALAITDALRERRIRTGLVARAGYHWSWFTARDHGADSPQAALAAARECELCRAADVVVASTRRMMDDLAWQHALAPGRVRAIPNYVNVGDAPAQSIERDPGFILAAGRLEPQKRFDLLIRAIALLARTHPHIRLCIRGGGGEGSLHAALIGLIAELRAPVDILPRIPQIELASEMSRCAVFAQVSAFEGHPKTIIEALAHGAPVVVTRGPGVDDEITPGVTGLITRDDPAAIAAAIASLLDDPQRADRMGTAAAADIRTRLDLDTVFPLVEHACRDALALNGAHASKPTGTVRWDQSLLNADPAVAAATFASAVNAYTKRLDPEAREAFDRAIGLPPDGESLRSLPPRAHAGWVGIAQKGEDTKPLTLHPAHTPAASTT